MIFKYLKKLFSFLENEKSNFIYWLILFLGIIFIRNMLEGYLEVGATLIDLRRFILQYPLWHISMLTSIILFLKLFTKERIDKVSKVFISFYSLIIAVPILDFIISSGQGFPTEYIKGNLVFTLNEFLTLSATIATPGQKIMAGVCLIILGSYVFYKTGKLINSLLALFVSYCIFFFWAAWPSFYLLILPNIASKTLTYHLEIVLALSVVVLSVCWCFFYNKDKLLAIIDSIIISRTAHYLAMVILGIAIFVHFNSIHFFNFENALVSVFAVFFAFQFAVITNNYFDSELDNELKSIFYPVSLIYFLFAVVFGLLVSGEVFAWLMFVMVLSFIYSAPPLRLKRLGFMNNVLIAVATWIVVTIGYASQGSVQGLIPFSAMIIVAYFLSAHFKDLKDLESDNKNGIRTLPVIFGKLKSKIAVSITCFFAYVAVPVLTGLYDLLIPSFIFGILSIFAIQKRNADEKLFFGLYFAFFTVLCTYLILF